MVLPIVFMLMVGIFWFGLAFRFYGTITHAGVCVQQNVQLSGVNSTGLAGCGVSVTFQYPYQFWLPFTSLSNQLIFVPAQARMKMESRLWNGSALTVARP